jgi:hypothetical protein
MKKIHLQ